MLRGNTLAGVLNNELVARVRFMPDRDTAVLAIELNTVVDKVCEHLFESSGVSVDSYVRSYLVDQPDSLRMRLCTEGSNHVIHQWMQVHSGSAQLDIATFDRGQLQDVVDQAVHSR